MTPYQLLDLAISVSNRIDTHWTLFISVHLAIIGGIIYVDRPLKSTEKVAAILVYTGFAVINYLMMYSQANFLSSIHGQIASMKELGCCNNNLVVDHIARRFHVNSISKTIMTLSGVHLAMYTLIILSLAFDKARVPPPSAE